MASGPSALGSSADVVCTVSAAYSGLLLQVESLCAECCNGGEDSNIAVSAHTEEQINSLWETWRTAVIAVLGVNIDPQDAFGRLSLLKTLSERVRPFVC